MLDTIGVTSAEALFEDIPEGLRLNRGLNFDNSMSEYSVKKHMHHLGQKNKTVNDYVSFLGAGTYDHYIPSAVAYNWSQRILYGLHALSARDQPGDLAVHI